MHQPQKILQELDSNSLAELDLLIVHVGQWSLQLSSNLQRTGSGHFKLLEQPCRASNGFELDHLEAVQRADQAANLPSGRDWLKLWSSSLLVLARQLSAGFLGQVAQLPPSHQPLETS